MASGQNFPMMNRVPLMQAVSEDEWHVHDLTTMSYDIAKDPRNVDTLEAQLLLIYNGINKDNSLDVEYVRARIDQVHARLRTIKENTILEHKQKKKPDLLAPPKEEDEDDARDTRRD